MAKAFFGIFLVFLGALLWITLPRAIKRPCPVCQGTGVLEASRPIVVGKGKEWIPQKTLLCPFCEKGRISLYDLKLHREQMLRWMVKEQKLDPETLVKRVKDGFGDEGLEALHKHNFFMDETGTK
jgi:hypothetical protein